MATDASPAAAVLDREALPFVGPIEADPGPTVLPDTELLEGVMTGSQQAFGRLYDRYVDVVYRASLRINTDRSAAAEVVQETFLTLWDRAEMFDASRGSLAAWLATIARNRAVDHLRRSARQPAMTFSSFGRVDTDDTTTAEWLARNGSMLGTAGSDPTPEDALAAQEISATLDRALASIGPAERQVILLAYRGGLSQSEIAAHLGWPLGTVKTRTQRALRLLRERLEPALAAEPREAGAAAKAAKRSSTRSSTRSNPSLCEGAS